MYWKKPGASSSSTLEVKQRENEHISQFSSFLTETSVSAQKSFACMPFTLPFKQLLPSSLLADYRNCWTEPHWEKDSLQFWNEFSQMAQVGAWLLPPCLSLSGEMNLNMGQFYPCSIFSAFPGLRKKLAVIWFYLSANLYLCAVWRYAVHMERNLQVSHWRHLLCLTVT